MLKEDSKAHVECLANIYILTRHKYLASDAIKPYPQKLYPVISNAVGLEKHLFILHRRSSVKSILGFLCHKVVRERALH